MNESKKTPKDLKQEKSSRLFLFAKSNPFIYSIKEVCPYGLETRRNHGTTKSLYKMFLEYEGNLLINNLMEPGKKIDDIP